MKTAILGGGASGLSCAIELKRRCPDADVIVYEKLDAPAKKLLATGNGRCNLSNREVDVSCYNGDSSLLYTVLEPFGTKECLRFFDSLGLITTEEDGRLYPQSMSAASVRDVLLQEVDRLGIPVITGFQVESIEPQEHGYRINGTESADFVVLALGGKAAAMHGTDGDGYRILKTLGVRYAPISPALVQLVTENPDAEALKGTRVRGTISLHREDGVLLAQEDGEIQFTAYGLSGIAAMQLSGDAAVLTKTEHPFVTLDLCPGMTQGDLELYLEDRRKACAGRPASQLLTGLVQKNVSAAVLRTADVDANADAATVRDIVLARIARTLKGWRFPVDGDARIQGRTGHPRRRTGHGAEGTFAGERPPRRPLLLRRTPERGRPLRRLQPALRLGFRHSGGKGDCATCLGSMNSNSRWTISRRI